MHLPETFRDETAEESRLQSSMQTHIQDPLQERTSVPTFVYNLEVEENHNFFANGVLVSNCDEFNFVADDEDLYDAILFTLGTTNGEFIASSTPWSRDHTFYKMCKDKDFDDFGRHHVTWDKALEPDGPLKKNILEKIKKQLAADPWRWQREMEAEWSEDESCWLPQGLIGQCQDSMLEIRIIDKRHSFWVGN